MTTPTPEHGLTPDRVAELSGGAVSATTEGLQESIDSAVAALRDYCGWHVWPQRRETLTIDGEGGRELSMPTLRVTDVHDVTDCGRSLTVDNDFEWSAVGDLRRLGACWSTRYRGIVADITHGYTDMPAAIQDVLVDVLLDRANAASGSSVAGVKLDGADVSYSNPFAPRGASSDVGARRNLGSYRSLDLYRIWPAP